MSTEGRFGLSPNALGSLYMTIGAMGYVVNDALVRLATDEGLDVFQVLCLRGLAMAAFFAAVGRARGEHLVISHLEPGFVVRVAAELVASALFFAALVRMEFANAQTILLIVPVAVTLAAALLLGERVSGRQYATILVGFVGVLIVVRPATDGFTVWSLVVVASAAGQVVRELATRKVTSRVPAMSIAFATAMGLAVLTGIISVFTGWGTITARGLLMIGLACACLVVGYLFTIQTVRIGDLSVSAPFRYTALLGAVVVGYLFFDEVPDAFTVVGSVVILATGLYAIYLERQTARMVRARGV